RALCLRMRCGVRVFTLAGGKKGLAWLAEVMFLPMMLAWIVEVILYAANAPVRLFAGVLETRLVDSWALQGLGILMLLASLILFAWALVSFGLSWRIGIDEDKPGDLVTRGAFAFSRNPIFVCLDLAFLGIFFVYGTAIFLLFAVLTMVGVHF